MYQLVNFPAVNLNTGWGLDADAGLARSQLD
jgi:hypothetical protein